MELTACTLTRVYLGDYDRTCPVMVEDELRAMLARASDFIAEPMPTRRASPDR
jgi:hypothetical protein